MKFFSVATSVVLFAASVASAWDLTLYMDDGRHVEAYGTLNSGCVDWDFDMSSPVNRAVFHGSAFADTFELYEGKGCNKLVYRNGEGDFSLTPSRIARSYSVY